MSPTESCVGYVSGLYAAMFSDIVAHLPDLRSNCDRDYKRLLRGVESHGLRFLFEVLPTFGKHFDLCLSSGLLIKSGLVHFGPFRHDTPIPRLFKGLVARIFNEDGVLRSDPCSLSIKFVRQLCLVTKRFNVQCPDSSTWEHVNEFYRIDSEVAQGSNNWSLVHPGSFDENLTLCELSDGLSGSSFSYEDFTASSTDVCQYLASIQLVADLAMSQVGWFDPHEWRPRHGPGAVSDSKGGYKYDFPTWPDKLDRIFPYADFAFANFGWWVDKISSKEPPCSDNLDIEAPSRLIAVPKDFSGPRLIASEPTSHQWCQQIIRDFLASRVKWTFLRNSIDFVDQTPNQVLAREASHSGSHSTIDLSSASDRISCYLVERIFRKNPSLLDAFHSVRTRWISQSIDKKSPPLYELRKFSTMGSAITFPVQTYVFAIIALGCLLRSRNLKPTMANLRKFSQEVRVFGDDIIVPIDCHGSVTGMLTLLGLKVNPKKTFRTGKFRESCGYDGYDGNNVTRISVMSVPAIAKPESIESAVDVHNNFAMRGYLCTANYVRKTVDSFKSLILREVDMDSGSFGWKVFGIPDLSSLRTKMDRDIQRLMVYVTVPISKMTKTPVERSAALLQYFTECRSLPISKEVRIGLPALRRSLTFKRVWVPV